MNNAMRLMKFGVAVLVGFVLGASMTVGAYYFLNRRTTVLLARETLQLESGIILPKGTRLIHHASYSEGFERLALYVNVPASAVSGLFDSSVDPHPFLEDPYWLK